MRRFIIIPILILLASCELSEPKVTALTLLVDRTDTIIPKPSMEHIRPMLALDKNPNSRTILNFQNIGNVDYSPIYHLDLTSSSFLENTLQRKSEVSRFYTSVDTLIQKQNTKSYHFQSSSIVVPLCKQLQFLSQSSASSKIIILYSDLGEFSDIYNVYDNGSYQKLLRDPKKTADHFRSKLNIPKCHGIRLYINYYPKTTAQNRLFQSMVTLYRELFKDSGLEIFVGISQKIEP